MQDTPPNLILYERINRDSLMRPRLIYIKLDDALDIVEASMVVNT